eukprot:1157490-Pelagomonas_calceolata.AAC.11
MRSGHQGMQWLQIGVSPFIGSHTLPGGSLHQDAPPIFPHKNLHHSMVRRAQVQERWSCCGGLSLEIHLFLPGWAQKSPRGTKKTSTCRFQSKTLYEELNHFWHAQVVQGCLGAGGMNSRVRLVWETIQGDGQHFKRLCITINVSRRDDLHLRVSFPAFPFHYLAHKNDDLQALQLACNICTLYAILCRHHSDVTLYLVHEVWAHLPLRSCALLVTQSAFVWPSDLRQELDQRSKDHSIASGGESRSEKANTRAAGAVSSPWVRLKLPRSSLGVRSWVHWRTVGALRP